jgi:Cys-rich protein (TIGR01571 family)
MNNRVNITSGLGALSEWRSIQIIFYFSICFLILCCFIFFLAGLFDCFDDTNICLYGLFCPCYLFGENVKRTRSTITLSCPCFLYACDMMYCVCWYRHRQQRFNLRSYYELPSGCGDYPTAVFCGPCALCQEARELNIRGL